MYKLYNDDCLDIMQDIEPESIDLVCTDPPYGISNECKDIIFNGSRSDIRQDFGEWDRFDSDESFGLFTLQWLKAAYRLLKPARILCFFFSIFKLTTAERLLKDAGFSLSDYFFKICTNPMPNFRKIGYRGAVEPVIICQKPGRQKGDKIRPFRTDLRPIPNYIRVPGVGGPDRTKHPTQKHVEAMVPLIKYWSRSEETVLDPFSGSGTTGVAACRLHRKYIGIEQDKEFYEISRQRLNAETNQVKLFAEDVM